jgi:hypothetical protein
MFLNVGHLVVMNEQSEREIERERERDREKERKKKGLHT